jgi:hypothetical protein
MILRAIRIELGIGHTAIAHPVPGILSEMAALRPLRFFLPGPVIGHDRIADHRPYLQRSRRPRAIADGPCEGRILLHRDGL